MTKRYDFAPILAKWLMLNNSESKGVPFTSKPQTAVAFKQRMSPPAYEVQNGVNSAYMLWSVSAARRGCKKGGQGLARRSKRHLAPTAAAERLLRARK